MGRYAKFLIHITIPEETILWICSSTAAGLRLAK
jgi:hypothetical protein